MRTAIAAALLLALMVAAVSTPATTAAEACWDSCIKKSKGEVDTCSPKCNEFCKNQDAAVGYFAMATAKLKEAATASPEKAVALKNEADTYLANAKKYNNAAAAGAP